MKTFHSMKCVTENHRGEGDSPILLRGLRKIGTVPDGFRIDSKCRRPILNAQRYATCCVFALLIAAACSWVRTKHRWRRHCRAGR